MKADDWIRAGNLDEALTTLKESIRGDPADWKLRVFLFQLLSVRGEWDAALSQLNVAADLNADCLLLAQLYRSALNAEAFRSEVFAGRRLPLFLGEPAEWIAWLAQVPHLLAEGNQDAAIRLRDQAFEAAPATSGTVDGTAFEWIADADSRLGPVLEAVIDGKYYWIPFCNIRDILIEKPQDLRDLVWLKARFTWTNQGTSAGLIPVRYAETEQTKDNALLLSRKTEWRELNGLFLGSGQRMLATDAGDHPLLDVRHIALTADGTVPQPSAEAP